MDSFTCFSRQQARPILSDLSTSLRNSYENPHPGLTRQALSSWEANVTV